MSEPWKVVSDPGYLGRGALDGPGAVTDGFDTAVPPGPASRALPQQLASYWQEWTITGHVPASSDLAPGQWTTQAGALMATTPDGAIRHFNGLAGYYFYHGGSPQEIWQFGTATGGLTCGVVREETYWDLPGYTLYQPKAQNNWGRTIAPGLYAAIVDSSIAQPCFLQGPGSKLGVVSGELDDDSMLGLGCNRCRRRRRLTRPRELDAAPRLNLPRSVRGNDRGNCWRAATLEDTAPPTQVSPIGGKSGTGRDGLAPQRQVDGPT